MNSRVIKSLYKKEMLDVLRDKKTVVMMLVVPLVLYPLVMILSLQLMTGITKSITTSTYRICLDFEGSEDYERLFQNLSDKEYSFEITHCENPILAMEQEELDAVIKMDLTADMECFEVIYLSSVNKSSYCADMVSDALQKYSLELTKKRLEKAGLNAENTLNPIKVSFSDRSTNEETAGSLLGTIIPFMLVMSLLMGTMYPAIDTTAGEKERGTLETMLTLPITNKELITSKFLAVGTIGIVSAVLNIISMAGVGAYMYGMVASMATSSGTIRLSKFLPAILVGILCIFAFAVFISAISMCVCALAKSYKEANNYLTPLTLVVMFASFIGFIPNVTLNVNTAIVPVANVCLLVRDLLAFKYDIGMIALVLFVNVAYGVVSVMLLARIYNSEAIIFGDGSGGIQIFEKRANIKKGTYPQVQDAWLVIIITAMLVIYAGGAMQLKFGLYGLLFTQFIIFAIPFGFACYTKKDIRASFKLKGCAPKYFVAAIFLIIGGIMAGIVTSELSTYLFKTSAVDAAETMNDIIGDRFLPVLFIVALAPAICEELMFRGYVLGSMTAKYKTGSAIIVSAVVFGLYHMSASKFLTTTMLGALLCYIAVQSGSILPGMLMHFINNAISCITMFYPEQVSKLLPIIVKEKIGISDMRLLAAAGILFILAGVWIGRKPSVVSDKKI
ncbi:MAG: ABC transporter permease subunit [Clostridium sp.]|nr:ABC transporter permease subunit [Clostridium sp.]